MNADVCLKQAQDYYLNKEYDFAKKLILNLLSSCNFQTDASDLRVKGAAWELLGAIYMSINDYVQAVSALNESMVNEFSWGVIANLTICYKKLGKNLLAIQFAKETLRIRPNLLSIRQILVDAYLELEMGDAMLIWIDEGLRLHPDDLNLCFSKAQAYSLKRDRLSAIHFYKIISNYPNHNLFGRSILNIFMEYYFLGKTEEAIQYLKKASDLNPLDRYVENSIALVEFDRGNFKEALDKWITLYQKYPDEKIFAINCSLILLLKGDYERGFDIYEKRFGEEIIASKKAISSPRWRGESLDGKTLYVFSEQGIGDTIQFMRYIPYLYRFRPRDVCIGIAPGLHPLFDVGSFKFVDSTYPPPHDIHIPLESLPFIFKTTTITIPPPALLRSSGLTPVRNRIGLVWKGNPQQYKDWSRSIELNEFINILKIPGLEFVSLQKDLSLKEAALLDDLGVHRPKLETWTDTIGVLQTCDKLVSVCTSLIHLAGSLGTPSWVLVSINPYWTWMLDRSNSPWYPYVKILRQQKFKSWKEPIQQLEKELIPK